MNIINKSLFVLLTAAVLAAQSFAAPSITGVTAQQRYPWNGEVEIAYTVSGDVAASLPEGVIASLNVTATDRLLNTNYVASSLSGDMALTDGMHSLVWDMAADGIALVSTDVVFTVSCEIAPATYCVIDLTAGESASSYPVTYLAEPPSCGFNVDEYKTTKLVLRRIEPGTFLMCGQYQTTLTKPYYIGIFEMTQKQYQLVMGSNPSRYTGDKRPVEKVSYNMIRGASGSTGWPTSTDVDSSSFMGKLRTRTGLNFDLPTEAQWEYACRAGTTSSYNNGGSTESDLRQMGRYSGNTSDGKGGYSQHTIVGSYLSNAWGLYDMHGNVCEWCLDWYGGLSSPLTDPHGTYSGEYRINRGGGWYVNAPFCTSSHRGYVYPNLNDYDYFGFRLSRETIATSQSILLAGSSEPTIVGAPKMPMIAPSSRIVAEWPITITISCATEGAIIHYTTNGTEPTATSPIYRRFRINSPTTVKAIAIWNERTSDVAVAQYAMEVKMPVINALSSFTGSETKVEISCATDGSRIYYTLDGSTPNSHSTRYTGPFYVTDSCTVKAYATCFDYLDSAVATQSIEKVWGVGDTLGAPDHTFTTGGDLPFVRVTDNTALLGESMKSGAITHSQQSTLSTTVVGPGTISFQWKTSCEKDPDDLYEWDHAEFRVDGELVARLDGQTAWQIVTHTISGSGSHTLLWKYIKDDMSSEGEDCCWVADYRWASAYTATQTTEVPVPYVWLRGYFPHTPDEYDAYESSAKDTAANGVNKVWECYVAGLVPTNAADLFRTVISMKGGKPQISWEPRLSAAEEAKRTYTIYGRESLTGGEWTTPTNAASRFFRVKVALP